MRRPKFLRESPPTHDVESSLTLKPNWKVQEIETGMLLQLAEEKLKDVQRKRYIMLQKAKIEAVCQGKDPEFVEKHTCWHDYSKCPKMYAF